MSKTLPKRILITLTAEQREQLEPLLRQVKVGGALVGQIWKDGIHVALLSPERAEQLTKALVEDELTLPDIDDRLCGSAQEAYTLSQRLNR